MSLQTDSDEFEVDPEVEERLQKLNKVARFFIVPFAVALILSRNIEALKPWATLLLLVSVFVLFAWAILNAWINQDALKHQLKEFSERF